MNCKYYIYPLLCLILSLSFSSCENDDTEGRTPSLEYRQRVNSIALNSNSLELTVGDTFQLTATPSPSTATNKAINWSSESSCVEVSNDGKITAKAIGEATITAAATDDSGVKATCKVVVKAALVKVSDIKLNESSLTMVEGETQVLKAEIVPENASNKNVTWSSSDTSVATVSNSGEILAVAAGAATITATAADGSGVNATCSVTVNAAIVYVSSISLNKPSASMTVGDTQSLSAAVSPSNATNKNVTWTSSNTSVATVSASGLVTAKAAGTATITATAADGSGVKATCSVTVNAAIVYVSSISLNKTSASMTVGDTQSLSATVSPSNATNKNVTWTSSNTSVATVSASGLVTAKAAGTATITATAADGSGVKATCSVTVNAAIVYVSSISLNKTSASMTVGDTQSLSATVSPSNATNKNVTWTSSNTSVATVSASGLVTAVAAGTATITATAADGSGVKATCSVTVNNAIVYVSSISLSKTSLTMLLDEKQTLSATVSPSNATNKNLTWTSSDDKVVTVSSSGVVTARAVGSAIITVAATDGSGVKSTCTITVKKNSSIDMEDYESDGDWN